MQKSINVITKSLPMLFLLPLHPFLPPAPTAPLSPDVYITQHKNASTLSQSLAADFHWMTPALTRGVLSHHYVTYWQGEVSGAKKVVKMKGTDRRFLLTKLDKSETYHFKVRQICKVCRLAIV